MDKAPKKKRVCVVGAGASGLAAIRHIKESQTLSGVVFESCGEIGGVWKCDGSTPMYRGLKTNLPWQIMGYLDFQFPTKPPGTASFLRWDEVYEFLNLYADKFQLRDDIQFNTRVQHIKPHYPVETNFEKSSNFVGWEITYETTCSGEDGKKKMEIFDAVIVCHGHYAKPLVPEGKKLHEFSGELIHSQNYNVPESFADKKVLVFGCGPSGIDIMLEIVDYASQTTLSLRKPPYPGNIPAKICQKPGIKDVQGHTVIFEDGSHSDFDIILNCTGYEYDLPFLTTEESGLEVEHGKFITPLYRHMININFPTMALIGLPFRICPFMLFDCQTRYFVKALEGQISLPSKDAMLQELEKEKEYRTLKEIPFTRSHQLEELQWSYMSVMGQEAGFSDLLHPLLPLTRKIYEKVAQRRRSLPLLYKNDEIQILNNAFHHIVEAI